MQAIAMASIMPRQSPLHIEEAVIQHAIIALLSTIAVFFCWLVVRLDPISHSINHQLANAVGLQLPWLALLLTIYITALLFWVITSWLTPQPWRRVGRIASAVMVLPSFALLAIISWHSWPMAKPQTPITNYQLPELLPQGTPPGDELEAWLNHRSNLLALFSNTIYGHSPVEKPTLTIQQHEQATAVFDGLGTRHQASLTFNKQGQTITIEVLAYLPTQAAAVFLMANFGGNQSISDDPAIRLATSWMPNDRINGVVEHRASEASRGVKADRWPVEKIVAAGFGLVTFYYGDAAPDHIDDSTGLHPLYPDNKTLGSVGAWAWAYQRTLDYLLQQASLANTPVIAAGHSRLGKAALWAGAQDDRFAAVISNNSGSLGAALSRRQYGETVADISQRTPHRFSPELASFSGREHALPVDQHQLLALIAPRPLYITSASEDRWADPQGEFLAALAASEAYRWYGLSGITDRAMPYPHEPTGLRLRYHLRRGSHDVTAYDWQQWLNYFQDIYGASQ